MKRRAKNLICYKEGRTQKWIMTEDSNNDEIIMNLLMNKKVDNHSIFIIPTYGMMLGGIWLWKQTHGNGRLDFANFFEEYNTKQPELKQNDEATRIAKEAKEDREEKQNSKYGFISPEGTYYGCEFEGHHDLAYRICFGQYETNNPERYLEEHGWCKIFRPFSHDDGRYNVYIGDKHVLTDAQFKTLQKMDLDKCKNVSLLLVR